MAVVVVYQTHNQVTFMKTTQSHSVCMSVITHTHRKTVRLRIYPLSGAFYLLNAFCYRCSSWWPIVLCVFFPTLLKKSSLSLFCFTFLHVNLTLAFPCLNDFLWTFRYFSSTVNNTFRPTTSSFVLHLFSFFRFLDTPCWDMWFLTNSSKQQTSVLLKWSGRKTELKTS